MRFLTILLLIFTPGLFGSMALPLPKTGYTTRPGQDHALFFAVNDYSGHGNFGNLSDPIASAEELSRELREVYGFQTEIVRNPTKDQIYRKLHEYRGRSFGANDQLLVFFSGHGDFDEFEKTGYFIPRSGPQIELVKLGNIITQIPCKHTLLAIDACYSGTIDNKIAFKGRFNRPGVTADTERDNLIARKLRNGSRLLLTSGAKERTPSGSGGSPFALGFLNALRAGYGSGDGLVTYEDLLARLERVSPVPYHGKLTGHEEGSFVFVADRAVTPAAASAGTKASFRSILPPPLRTTPSAGGNKPPDNMVFVKGGTFQMGDQFRDGEKDERPIHPVALGSFYIANREVKNWEFAKFLNAVGNHEHGGGKWYTIVYEGGIKLDNNKFSSSFGLSDHPVSRVSWYGAISYCNWLSEQHGLRPVYIVNNTKVTPDWSADGYRLPTEAEWEYAARNGGRKIKWSGTSSENELNIFANIKGVNGAYRKTTPVGMLKPNSLGLFDMTGNVREWCWDTYGGNYYRKSPRTDPKGPFEKEHSSRVIRGGSYGSEAIECRNTARYNGLPYYTFSVGFRLARSY